MIKYFPRPLPGETWYSILCRLAYFLDLNHKQFLKVVEIYDLPKNTLLGQINFEKYTATFGYNFTYWKDQIVDKHTLIPYLTGYVNKGKLEDILSNKKLPASFYEYNSIYNDNSPKVKFCLKCIKKRNTKHRHPYLDLNEQLWGYYVCPIHNIPLSYIDVSKNKKGIKLIDLSSILTKKSDIKTIVIPHNLQDFKRLSELSIKKNKVQESSKNIKDSLINNYYKHKNYYYEWEKLSEDLKLYFGKPFLDVLFKLSPTISLEPSFLRKEFSSIKHIYNPILVLLLEDFFNNLDLYPSDLFETNTVFKKGKNNQHCISKVCDYYNEECAILERLKNRSTTNIIGYFRCPHCEMLYSLSYFTNKSLSKRPRVIEYGSLFLDKLKSLMKENVSIYKIKKLLGSHEFTLLKLIYDLDLDYKYWEDEIKNNKRLQDSIRLITDLLESDISLSKQILFAHYKEHFDYIRYYDRRTYERISKKLKLRGSN